MKKHQIYAAMIENKKNNLELILTTVFAAVGVNLLSSGVSELFEPGSKGCMMSIIGALMTVYVIGRVIVLRRKAINHTVSVDGFFVYEKNSKKLISVPRYGIAMDMEKLLSFAFSENGALEVAWNNTTPDQYRKTDEKTENGKDKDFLLLELIEYCVIQKLSTHLTNYFNGEDREKQVQVFSKNDVPDILLNNRFLKLFAEDIKNRPIFVCQKWGSSIVEYSDKIISATNISGGHYQKFELTLPKGSRVKRKDGVIEIKTPMFTIALSCDFGGGTTVLRPGFYSNYLGITTMGTHWSYGYTVKVSVEFTLLSLLSKEKGKYYAWVDSFLDDLTHYLGEDEFFEHINWDTVCTLLHCNRIADEKSQEKQLAAIGSNEGK